VFYVFIKDLMILSLGYRIVALMLISSISLAISVFYSPRIKERKGDHEDFEL
jgi:hypothetical protein